MGLALTIGGRAKSGTCKKLRSGHAVMGLTLEAAPADGAGQGVIGGVGEAGSRWPKRESSRGPGSEADEHERDGPPCWANLGVYGANPLSNGPVV